MASSIGVEEKWLSELSTTKDRLEHIYKSGQYSDLVIVFPEYGITLKAHRLVLAMSSPVFGAMLMGPLAVQKELELNHDSPESVRKLLDHMYLDSMDLHSVDEALEVYEAAHKYQLEAAKKLCSEYIVSNLTKESTLVALEAAVLFDDEAINRKCVQILNQNTDDVMSPDSVVNLKRTTLRNLLKKNDLTVSSETVLVKGIIAWGEAQLRLRGEEPTSSALRAEIEDLLKEVRFLTMSCEEFIDNVIDTNVLSHTECIHILKAIRGADLSTIPASTPLNPSTIQRRKKLEYIRADLGRMTRSGYVQQCKAHLKYTVLSELRVSNELQVHHMTAAYDGSIQLEGRSGEILASASSQDKTFTFPEPVTLSKNKVYNISFNFRHDKQVPYGSEGNAYFTTTAGDVAFSYKNMHRMNLGMYFLCDQNE